MLLERAPLSIPRALERMGGLQAQYAPSMYVGLSSRVEGFERDALTRALERRSVVQGTLMRSTIHLVSAARLLAAGADRRAIAPGLVAEGQPQRPRRARHEHRCAPPAPEVCRGHAAARRGRAGHRQAAGRRHRPVAAHRARPAVGHLGAPPRGPLRPGRGLARAARGRPRRRRRPRGAALPRGLRPRHAGRDRQLGGRARRRGRPGTRRACACAASPPRTATSWSTCRARRCPTPRRRRPSGCSGPGTRSCSPTRGARTSCPSAFATACSASACRSR